MDTAVRDSRFNRIVEGSELYELCAKLGFSAPIWHRTRELMERLDASVDQVALDECRSSPKVFPVDYGVICDFESFHLVLGDATQCAQRIAQRARVRGCSTREVEQTLQLIHEMRSLVTEQQAVSAPMVLDFIDQMTWFGIGNWENLPDSLYQQKKTLDGVLMQLRPAIEQQDPSWLAEAVHTYVANDWMHVRWLTTEMAQMMLIFNLRDSLQKRSKVWGRWSIALSVGAFLLLAMGARLLAGGLLLADLGMFFVTMQIARTDAQVQRTIDEIGSTHYSGPVLADRLASLDGFRCQVPSILIELLRTRSAR